MQPRKYWTKLHVIGTFKSLLSLIEMNNGDRGDSRTCCEYVVIFLYRR